MIIILTHNNTTTTRCRRSESQHNTLHTEREREHNKQQQE